MLDRDFSMKFFQRVRSWAKQLKRDGVTLWFACTYPKTPWYSKALALFVVGYALSPIDLIPDFVPVLGYLDDVLLLPGLIWLAIYLTPAEVLKECRAQGEEWIAHEGRNPRSLWGAWLIIIVWISTAWAAWLWWLRPLLLQT